MAQRQSDLPSSYDQDLSAINRIDEINLMMNSRPGSAKKVKKTMDADRLALLAKRTDQPYQAYRNVSKRSYGNLDKFQELMDRRPIKTKTMKIGASLANKNL